jgi:hypothetical protein
VVLRHANSGVVHPCADETSTLARMRACSGLVGRRYTPPRKPPAKRTVVKQQPKAIVTRRVTKPDELTEAIMRRLRRNPYALDDGEDETVARDLIILKHRPLFINLAREYALKAAKESIRSYLDWFDDYFTEAVVVAEEAFKPRKKKSGGYTATWDPTREASFGTYIRVVIKRAFDDMLAQNWRSVSVKRVHDGRKEWPSISEISLQAPVRSGSDDPEDDQGDETVGDTIEDHGVAAHYAAPQQTHWRGNYVEDTAIAALDNAARLTAADAIIWATVSGAISLRQSAVICLRGRGGLRHAEIANAGTKPVTEASVRKEYERGLKKIQGYVSQTPKSGEGIS